MAFRRIFRDYKIALCSIFESAHVLTKKGEGGVFTGFGLGVVGV